MAREARTRRGAPMRRRLLRIYASGRVAGATQVPSPNFDERPAGVTVSLVVVHGISLPPGRFGGAAIQRLFTNRLNPASHPYFASIAGLRVSAHFLIRRDGELLQFVDCNARAWHAGASTFRDRSNCNDFSIGIELEGTDERPYTGAQYRTLSHLIEALRARYPIRDVAGHSDIAPGRKTDPGPSFDWRRICPDRRLPR